jgi:uncharacterized protein YecE (DUF72 family)
MKFGKIENVDHIDFSLPALKVMYDYQKENGVVETCKLYGGTTGWSHSAWKGTFYPPKIKSTEQLSFYAKQCNSIELNTTHYRIPPIEMIQKWVGSVPEDFKFCPKVLKYISHSRSLGVDTDRIERFCEHIRYFGRNLGPVFMQLPPYFDTTKLNILEKFLTVFPLDIPLSIELRHPSWFTSKQHFELIASLLSDQNRGLVITDVAGRRDVAHMWICASHLIVRFGGNGGHSSDAIRLNQWKNIILQLAEIKMKEIYFFSHQSSQTANQAMYNIMYFADVLNQKKSIETRGPSLIEKPQTRVDNE